MFALFLPSGITVIYLFIWLALCSRDEKILLKIGRTRFARFVGEAPFGLVLICSAIIGFSIGTLISYYAGWI